MPSDYHETLLGTRAAARVLSLPEPEPEPETVDPEDQTFGCRVAPAPEPEPERVPPHVRRARLRADPRVRAAHRAFVADLRRIIRSARRAGR